MGNLNESKDLWESLSKNKVMKVIIIVIFASIAVFFLTIAVKAIKGDHEKIFGIEINDKREEKVVLEKPKIIPQVKQRDTNTNAGLKVDKPLLKKDVESIPKKIQRKRFVVPYINPTTKDTSKSRVSVEFKAPVMQSPMQFGNNNTQNNQILGKVERHPSTQDVNSILHFFTDKKRKLTLQYETPDIESKNYCRELKSILNNQGYRDVVLFDHLNIGIPAQEFKIQCDTAQYNISVELN